MVEIELDCCLYGIIRKILHVWTRWFVSIRGRLPRRSVGLSWKSFADNLAKVPLIAWSSAEVSSTKVSCTKGPCRVCKRYTCVALPFGTEKLQCVLYWYVVSGCARLAW